MSGLEPEIIALLAAAAFVAGFVDAIAGTTVSPNSRAGIRALASASEMRGDSPK